MNIPFSRSRPGSGKSVAWENIEDPPALEDEVIIGVLFRGVMRTQPPPPPPST